MSNSIERKKLKQNFASEPPLKQKKSDNEEKFSGAVKDSNNPPEKNNPREQEIEALRILLDKGINEAKEHLDYDGANNIKDFRIFLSKLKIDQFETGIQSIILKLRKQADEIMEGLCPIDFIVEQLNKKHAVVMDKVQYMTFDAKGDFSIHERKDLINRYENQQLANPSDPKKVTTKAHIWLKNPNRREYEQIVFVPTNDPAKIKELEEQGFYNLWRGFSVEAKPGKGKGKDGRLLFWDHVEEVICNRDPELYKWVRKWVAMGFQHPEKVHTALVIRGGQGAGKDTFAVIIGKLWGKHSLPLNTIAELDAKFNWHFKDKILVIVSEAEWNSKTAGAIKGMVTQPDRTFEEKYRTPITLPNYMHLILLSNNSQPVKLDADDRRFCVLDASSDRIGDKPYFNAIYNEQENGGNEILLWDLLNEPLDGFDPTNIPYTEAKFDLKNLSGDSADKYIFEALQEGQWGISEKEARSFISWMKPIKNDLYKDYEAYCEESGEDPLKKGQFFARIKDYIPSADLKARTRDVNKRQIRIIEMPDLETCRQNYSKKTKTPYDKIFKFPKSDTRDEQCDRV